jgi:hypothetical protein
MANFKQGRFIPKNPEKYRGDVEKIRYMSSWELKFNHFLDNNANILEWASEEIAIPYIKPTDGRLHKYYPDYYIMYKNKTGNIVREVIEIKPKSQVNLKKRANLYEQLTFAVNEAKWRAAEQFCQHHGFKFRIVTEDHLFGGKPK